MLADRADDTGAKVKDTVAPNVPVQKYFRPEIFQSSTFGNSNYRFKSGISRDATDPVTMIRRE